MKTMGQQQRIDVHHHVATKWHPLFGVPHGRMWWSVDNAIRVMDDNEIRVAILSPVERLPRSKAPLKAMMAVRDGPIGRIKPIRELVRKATRQGGLCKTP
jgi:hypothetical protein